MSQCPYSTEALSQGATFAQGRPLELMKEVRNHEAVSWHRDTRNDMGYWAVMRQKEIDYVSKNPLLFSSAAKGIAFQEIPEDMLELQRQNLITMDPPNHLRYRRIVNAAFKPRYVEALHERFVDVFNDTLEPLLKKNHCEFVKEVSCELPLIAICEILGVPIEDRDMFFRCSNTLLGSDEDEEIDEAQQAISIAAQMELYGYADKVMEMARDNLKDDIVGTLLTAEIDGHRLTDDEFRSFFFLLIVAGNETTRTATTHGMRLLMEHPVQYQMLVDDPSLVEHAVEEILRFTAPIQCMRRTAMEDTELAGQQIKQGDKVVLFYQSSNHDESVFTDPEVFDITRGLREEVRNAHRSFGVGEHFCLGSHLARLELQVTFDGIVKHIRNPRLSREPEWVKSNFINSIREMNIEYDLAES